MATIALIPEGKELKFKNSIDFVKHNGFYG
jgi:hypothetical protein